MPAQSTRVNPSNRVWSGTPTAGIRYIGSKERLLSFIEECVLSTVADDAVEIGDLFAGTAAVSKLFKQHQKKITANDNLKCCYVFAQAILGNNQEPGFESLSDVIRPTLKGNLVATQYDAVLQYLNSLPGEEGFIYREYSPGGSENASHKRAYFVDSNARKIDTIRRQVFSWKNDKLLSEPETCLLLSDLMRAANRVANISGTYGCFNRAWDPRAYKELTLERAQIVPSKYSHKVFCEDANDIAKRMTFDVLYLDPPYTWRHYGAYYHILETIAEGDEPTVSGRTGLRPWTASRSRYSYRDDASKALRELLASATCKHVFLSYNSEGLIAHEEIMDAMRLRGRAKCWEIGHRRYKSNSGGSNNKKVTERLYYVKTA